MPSVSTTLNSVQANDLGVTLTSPAIATMPFDVETVTAPCWISTDEPSNFTRESPSTETLEPGSLILATELGRVCSRSPEKIEAEERGTRASFTKAAPLI